MAKFVIEIDLADAPTVGSATDAVAQMLLAFNKAVPPGGILQRLLDKFGDEEGQVILFEAIDEHQDIKDGTVSARALLSHASFDRTVLARAQAARAGSGMTVTHADGRKEHLP